MASEETLPVQGKRLSAELGMIAVKGKTVPVRIYELLGTREDLSDELSRRCAAYAEAVGLLKDRKIAEARRDLMPLFAE
jgi:hypothetical protein